MDKPTPHDRDKIRFPSAFTDEELKERIRLAQKAAEDIDAYFIYPSISADQLYALQLTQARLAATFQELLMWRKTIGPELRRP